MTVTFPDHGPQEEILHTSGDAELLIKAGTKILRWRKALWGSADDAALYQLLGAYCTGRVLNTGLGMGLSVDEALSHAAVTSVVAWELRQEIIDVYAAAHEPLDERLSILAGDCYAQPAEGTFDLVLFELPIDTQQTLAQALDNIGGFHAALNPGGNLVFRYDRFGVALADALGQPYHVLSLARGPRPDPVWAVVPA